MSDETAAAKKARGSNLLEDFREKPHLANTRTVEGEWKKMIAIQRHRNEFPAKLRPIIDAASTINSRGSLRSPEEFFTIVYAGLCDLFVGRFSNPDATPPTPLYSSDWHGLDKNIDTEEQVELALRVFPKIVRETFEPMDLSRTDYETIRSASQYDMSLILSSAKAVSFVLLFLKLRRELWEVSMEWLWTVEGEIFRVIMARLTQKSILKPVQLRHLQQLLVNRRHVLLFGEESSDELDEESLAVLVRVKDTGFLKAKSLEFFAKKLVKYLFSYRPTLKSTLIEQRLRFLIEWHPSISIKDVLDSFLKYFPTHPTKEDPDRLGQTLGVGIFETILVYGLSRSPSELGFIFHGRYFRDARARIGSQNVASSFQNSLQRVLAANPTRTLLDFVVEAAPNEKIAHDGLYTLLRFDPAQALGLGAGDDGNGARDLGWLGIVDET